MTNPLPPAANKKPKGCTYPKCDCADVFCKEVDPMTNQESSVGKYQVRRGKDGKLNIYLTKFNVRIATFSDGFSESERESFGELLSTRAQAPDGGKWSAVWIDAEDKQPSIRFWAESQPDVDRICDALNDAADIPPTPQEADQKKLERVIAGLRQKKLERVIAGLRQKKLERVIAGLRQLLSAVYDRDPRRWKRQSHLSIPPSKEDTDFILRDAIDLLTALQSTPPQQKHE